MILGLPRLGQFIVCLSLCQLAFAGASYAQGLVSPPGADAVHGPIPAGIQADVVQSTVNSVTDSTADSMPVDVLPVQIPTRKNSLQDMKEGALFKLPARLYFNANVENSLRFESNVFQTLHNQRQDMVYRLLPNVTLGYALSRRTRVFTNYFLLRDQYTDHSSSLTRNIQSVGYGIEHDIPLTEKTTLTAKLFTRELFISNYTPLNDILPSLMLVRRVGSSGIVYGGVIGQLRWRNVLGQWQEGDQFYSMGYIYRKNRWVFSADTTLVSNFGVRSLRGGANNQMIISTLEADRQLFRKVPVVAFVRVQPIFNMGANESPGFAGFNVRAYGGLRMDIAKPALFPVKPAAGEKLAKGGTQL